MVGKEHQSGGVSVIPTYEIFFYIKDSDYSELLDIISKRRERLAEDKTRAQVGLNRESDRCAEVFDTGYNLERISNRAGVRSRDGVDYRMVSTFIDGGRGTAENYLSRMTEQYPYITAIEGCFNYGTGIQGGRNEIERDPRTKTITPTPDPDDLQQRVVVVKVERQRTVYRGVPWFPMADDFTVTYTYINNSEDPPVTEERPLPTLDGQAERITQ